MSIEKDQVEISAGWMNGLTTGGPIALTVYNRDWRNWQERDITPMNTPRPGHADLTGAIKYGYRAICGCRWNGPAPVKRLCVWLPGRSASGFWLSSASSSAATWCRSVESKRTVERMIWAMKIDFRLAEENDVRCPDPEYCRENARRNPSGRFRARTRWVASWRSSRLMCHRG